MTGKQHSLSTILHSVYYLYRLISIRPARPQCRGLRAECVRVSAGAAAAAEAEAAAGAAGASLDCPPSDPSAGPSPARTAGRNLSRAVFADAVCDVATLQDDSLDTDTFVRVGNSAATHSYTYIHSETIVLGSAGRYAGTLMALKLLAAFERKQTTEMKDCDEWFNEDADS